MSHLQIGDLAERTGVAAGTIRMWETRHGFPRPTRTETGYRRYSEDDVEAVRRVALLRERGLSMAAAIERAGAREFAEQPSIFAAVAGTDPAARPQTLSKRALVALSRAIEDETMATGSRPVVVGAFQHERFYRPVEHRYERMARVADAAWVFADFPAVRRVPGWPAEVPLDLGAALSSEWAVVVDAPGFAACLLAWEHLDRPGQGPDAGRRFEALWTVDPHAVRAAVRAAVRLAAGADPGLGQELEAVVADRPLAFEEPAPALTALTSRMVGYLEKGR